MNSNNTATNMAPTNIPTTLIDNLWDGYQRNFNSGSQAVIEMPVGLQAVIGPEELKVLMDRFSDFVDAPATVIHVPNQGLVKIVPDKNPKGWARGVSRRKFLKAKHKAEKIRRPPNGFILYRKHHHYLIKARDPTIHNNDISKEVGVLWKNESPEVKAEFIQRSEEMKLAHKKKWPDYVFAPRKAGVKKKRMTQKKREALATMTSQEEGSSNVSFISTETVEQSAEIELPRTTYGNVVFELGEESLDPLSLANALHDYNSSFAAPNNQVGVILSQTASPVLHNQPPVDAQYQQQFFDVLDEFTSLGDDDMPIPVACEDNMDGSHMNDLEQRVVFDESNSLNFGAELQRMQYL